MARRKAVDPELAALTARRAVLRSVGELIRGDPPPGEPIFKYAVCLHCRGPLSASRTAFCSTTCVRAYWADKATSPTPVE